MVQKILKKRVMAGCVSTPLLQERTVRAEWAPEGTYAKNRTFVAHLPIIIQLSIFLGVTHWTSLHPVSKFR